MICRVSRYRRWRTATIRTACWPRTSLGYMNQITPEELADKRQRADTLNYHLGDYVGRAGLERQWESFLRGKDGVERIVVDAKGQRKVGAELEALDSLFGGRQRTEPEPGNDLITSIDLDLQEVVETALAQHRAGAAAVVEVETGRRAGAGLVARARSERAHRPAYAREADGAQRRSAASDDRQDAARESTSRDRPSRSCRRSRRSRSTWSIPKSIVICHGGLHFGNRLFHCVETHGQVNLHFALAESCNVYFYELGETLGLDRMARVARRPRLRRTDGARAQRRGRPAWCRRWTTTSAAGRLPEGLRAQHRHRAGRRPR